MLFFFAIFILKLDEPFRNEEIFIISPISKGQIWVSGVKKFFLQYWLIFYPLDPGSQNLADPTDPDPKHCYLQNISGLATDDLESVLQTLTFMN